MSVKINQETCIRCKTCVAMCPANFKATDSGDIEVISQDITDDTKGAEQACPAQAISID